MAISDPEWLSISNLVNKEFKKRGEYFILDRVTKRDEKNRLVWVKELGDQPIPLIAFNYTVEYYDVNQLGNTVKKTAKVKVQVPKIGQTVLVAQQFGTRRLPRCLGVVQSTNYVLPVEE
jgi:hypothetical protein